MSGHRISISDILAERFWQVAILTAGGAIGLARLLPGVNATGYSIGQAAQMLQQLGAVLPADLEIVLEELA